MAFQKGNKLRRFTGMKHKPESNKKRSDSIKKLYTSNRPVGMGFSKIYSSDEERLRARYSSQLKCRYGISLDDYENMYQAQEGGCAICGDKHPKLVVDHCHESGSVRGLLCRHCNMLLGAAYDSTAILTEATIYLTRTHTHKSKSMGVLKRRLSEERVL